MFTNPTPSPPGYASKCQYPPPGQTRAQRRITCIYRSRTTPIRTSAIQTTRPLPSRSNFDTITSSHQSLLARQQTSTLHTHNLYSQSRYRHQLHASSLSSRNFFPWETRLSKWLAERESPLAARRARRRWLARARSRIVRRLDCR